jgi:hypothetical protein
MDKQKQKTNRKYFINIALLIIFTAGTLFLLLKDDFASVVSTISQANVWYLLVIVVLMAAYFFLEGCTLTIFAKIYKRSYSLIKGILNGMIGVFFSGITPSASGGQFAQAYTFGKQGIKISNSASILFMNFIVYQSVLVIYVLIALLFRFNEFTAILPSLNLFGFNLSFLSLTLIGFGINAVVIGGLFFMAYSKFLHRLILVYGISFLAKIKIVKNPEKMQNTVEYQVATFKREFTKLLGNYKILLIVAAIHALKLTIFYSIPYLATIALGASADLTESIVMSSYLYMITSYFPLPGASGGSETFFVIMFKQVIKASTTVVDTLVTSIMLVWRFATFYIGLILGAITVVAYRESGTQEFVTMANPKIILTSEFEKIQLDNENIIDEREKE